MARCEATKTIDITDWISTLQKGSDVCPDMQIYQPADPIILRTVALHGGLWVKDLTLNKLHRSNLFYVTVYFVSQATREYGLVSFLKIIIEECFFSFP